MPKNDPTPSVGDYDEARQVCRERGWKIVQHVQHTRGARINVLTRAGVPRTLKINS
jgi:hypothetical protein